MPSDFRILGPQVKNGEEGRGMEGRRERGELGRREGMEKGVARPNDISDTTNWIQQSRTRMNIRCESQICEHHKKPNHYPTPLTDVTRS